MKTSIIAIYLCIIALMVVVVDVHAKTNAPAGQRVMTAADVTNSAFLNDIRSVCDSGRNNDNVDDQKLCGLLQDEYNVKYVCNSYNCWVEVK